MRQPASQSERHAERAHDQLPPAVQHEGLKEDQRQSEDEQEQIDGDEMVAQLAEVETARDVHQHRDRQQQLHRKQGRLLVTATASGARLRMPDIRRDR